MNTKSLLTRIGVPVLSLGLLGGLGANLVGKTVTITGHLDQSGIQYKGFDPSIGYGPHARVYFVGAGGTSDQSPQGYEGQSWWANSGSPNAILDLTQSGDFTLTVTVSPDP